MSGKLADNLRSSVAIGAVHGTHQERSICENQMVAAANELDERFRQILALEAKVERLSKVLKESQETIEMLLLFYRDVFNRPTLNTIERVSKETSAALREAGIG